MWKKVPFIVLLAVPLASASCYVDADDDKPGRGNCDCDEIHSSCVIDCDDNNDACIASCNSQETECNNNCK